MKITTQEFSHLSATDIYDMLQLRSAVFVVEQDCCYLDPDDIDRNAWHCWIKDDDEKTIGVSRIFMFDEKFAQIGRVATAKSVRGLGIGRRIHGRWYPPS